MNEQHLIFMSYDSADRERVFEYYDFLTGKGLPIWMDKRRIKGGQDWDFECMRALQKASIVVVFLSHNYVSSQGYAQRESKVALDQARAKKADEIYIIPVLLDADLPIPSEYANIHVLRAEDGDPKQATAEAIDLRLEQLEAETARIQGESELSWTLTTHKDVWDGLPGYESEYQVPSLASDLYPHACEITDVVRGWLLDQVMGEREVKFGQDSEFMNFGQGRHRRQNSWEASCGDPKIKGTLVTIAYSIWWYGAGAAHPNQGFHTFAFTLDPVTQIKSLEDIFETPDEALLIIQAEVRTALLAQRFDEGEGEAFRLDQEWVDGGTKEWGDFGNFVFGEDGIEFLFGSYHVAPYAYGPQTAIVSYQAIVKLMKKHIASALGVEHLQHDWTPFTAAGDEQDAGDKAVE